MSLTNIDIDDELLAVVMNRFSLPTKKSAVNMALQRLVEETDQMKLIDSVFGIGWDGPPNGRFTDELHTR
ncbi:MAG: type II toxin-antitoxin system VapB family antitoxin [Candidatus Nanopelagicales bacterium]|jgi:Arc/MetJ family transcription regulator|nr:type II toxin-antitoxin system VapB family antitoxin [Candidatus Nanopelagicales bacterium]